MNITFDNILPWAVGGAGLLIAYHFLMGRQEQPRLAAAGNSPNFPDFPKLGDEPFHELAGVDPQIAFPHPYAHEPIPHYHGAGSYFQNSIPLSKEHYIDDVWYDKQEPPLHIQVSQNLPTPETYSHHKMFFESNGPEPSPLDTGILKNIV